MLGRASDTGAAELGYRRSRAGECLEHLAHAVTVALTAAERLLVTDLDTRATM